MEIDRLPTKVERIIAAIGSLLIGLLFGVVACLMVYRGAKEPGIVSGGYLAGTVLSISLVTWAFFLLFRILFRSPRLPSPGSRAAFGLSFVFLGVVMCIAPVFSWFQGAAVQSILQGVAAIFCGAAWAGMSRGGRSAKT